MGVEYIYDYIIGCLPDVDGYGNYNKQYDDDGVSDHSAFKQSIREDHPGDVGVFVYNNAYSRSFSKRPYNTVEVQVAVNSYNDLTTTIQYLNNLFNNICSNLQSENIKIQNYKMLNLAPVGKNSNGLQVVVLNIRLNYIILGA